MFEQVIYTCVSFDAVVRSASCVAHVPNTGMPNIWVVLNTENHMS